MAKQPTKKIKIKSRYIDVLIDWGFKRCFGTEDNKKNLILLLNDLLKGEKQIVDLFFMPTETLGELEEHKKIVFDLKCLGADGEIFLIEVQRLERKHFKDRVLHSTSRIISNFYAVSDEYQNKPLPEIYFIGILEDFSTDAADPSHYLRHIELVDRETGKTFYHKLKYVFLELSNFVKTGTELESDLDKWAWLLKNISKLDRFPHFLEKEKFQAIFDIAEVSNLTEEQLMAYTESLQAKYDWEDALSLAEERAAEKAAEKERAKAEKEIAKLQAKAEQAIAAQQKAEADKQKAEADKLESASKMKKAGLPLSQISEFTNLPLDVVEKL